jgi:hypothetical protein
MAAIGNSAYTSPLQESKPKTNLVVTDSNSGIAYVEVNYYTIKIITDLLIHDHIN